jgi:hypothetical protein
MQGEDRDRSTLPIAGRVVNELIIAGDLGEAERGETVIGFDDLLRASSGQLSVADDTAQSACCQIQLGTAGDLIDQTGQSNRVVRLRRAAGGSMAGHAAAAPANFGGHSPGAGWPYDRTAQPPYRCQPGVCFNP